MIEQCYSLRRAAKVIGVARETLKLWLAEEGLLLPRLPKGARAMIRQSTLDRLIQKRSPKAYATPLRRAS